MDWKERGHKTTCKRLVKEAKGAGDASTPTWKKTPPPVVDGPTPGREDVERARATVATTPSPPAREDAREDARCPVCLEDWDVNVEPTMRICCSKNVCRPCSRRLGYGHCPLCRSPTPVGPDAALAMIRRNVANDVPAAICHLGSCYRRGHMGLVPSHKKASRLYHKAAMLGDMWAMNNLGHAYANGHGVKLDKKTMVKYYKMAADRGHAAAQFNYGCCFHFGNGVAMDYAEAVRLYRLAAAQDLREAVNAMGVMYEHGDGVPRDVAAAVRCYGKAAAVGHEKAKQNLAQLLESQTLIAPS